MRDRARLVDIVLRRAWTLHVGAREKDVDLIAVGGYGRGELHPVLRHRRADPAAEERPRRGPRRPRALPDLPLGHRPRSRPQRAHDRRLPARERGRRQRRHDVHRGAAARRAGAPVPGDAPRARPGQRLVVAGVLRGEGRRAAVAAPPLPRHRPTTSSPTSRRARAGCATSRPSAGSPSATSAPTRSTNWSSHGFLTASELRKLRHGAGLPLEGALRAARADRAARGPAAVRPPDPHRADVRLRGRELHARRRAVHAALLPHGHGRQPAERNAAAAVPRGDPGATRRRRSYRSTRASRSATTTSR